jgi:hypothetical protein
VCAQAELIGLPLHAIGGMDIEAKLELVQGMMEVPSSKLARPVTVSSSFRRRHSTTVRIETQHQNIWIESMVPHTTPHAAHTPTHSLCACACAAQMARGCAEAGA